MLDNGRKPAENSESPCVKSFGTKQMSDVSSAVPRPQPIIVFEGSTFPLFDTELLDDDNRRESKPKTNQSTSLLHSKSYR